MPTYTVVDALIKKELPDQGNGAKKVIKLDLSTTGGDVPFADVQAEWFTNADTPVPAPGSSIDGEVSDSPYGQKFKKSGGGGFRGGNSGGSMPPDRERAIVRQHSQATAIAALDLAFSLGVVKPKPETTVDLLTMIAKLSDFFDKDVARAKAGTS